MTHKIKDINQDVTDLNRKGETSDLLELKFKTETMNNRYTRSFQLIVLYSYYTYGISKTLLIYSLHKIYRSCLRPHNFEINWNQRRKRGL